MNDIICGAKSPSTEVTKGVKVVWRVSHGSQYFLFFSSSAERRTAATGRDAWEGASVSMTRISNNASLWAIHTPRQAKSPRSPVSPSEMTGSFVTFPQACWHSSQKRSLISLCLRVIRPPVLQHKAWSTLKLSLPQPSQVAGMEIGVRWYLMARASLNSWGDKSKLSFLVGITESHVDVFVFIFVAIDLSIALFFLDGNFVRMLSRVSFSYVSFSLFPSFLASRKEL